MSDHTSTDRASTDRASRATVRQRRREPLLPTGPVRASANVCQGSGCLSMQSDLVFDALRERVLAAGLPDVAVRRVGCPGLCAAGPLVDIPESGRLFEHVQADERSLAAVMGVLGGGEGGRSTASDPFFGQQVKVVLEHCGRVDPERVEDYVAVGGFEALRKAVTTMSPAEVVAEVVGSGLRGRGGGGYPTGLKWTTVAKAESGEGKFVVCNADEGDPGAFMDRSVLESCPQQVLEGMAIAGYAVGAVARLRLCARRVPAGGQAAYVGHSSGPASAACSAASIADSSFDFHIEVRIGAGAFVCGEETALIASIEGGRGTPRPRPPYPAASGLWGRPTLINNVETLASIPAIISKGRDWYSSIGTEQSRGTKVFALAGSVVNTGLIEVPMGLTLRQIVFDIGGGLPDGGRFKAVQTGGPSGGCIPEDLLDMPVDYESLGGVARSWARAG